MYRKLITRAHQSRPTGSGRLVADVLDRRLRRTTHRFSASISILSLKFHPLIPHHLYPVTSPSLLHHPHPDSLPKL